MIVAWIWCSLVCGWTTTAVPTDSIQPPVNRYIVYFTDKVGSPCALSTPTCFLSARARARRRKHDVLPTVEDLPVSRHYLKGLQALGLRVYFSSRWLNAALLQCAPERILAVRQLPYVRRVSLISPGRRLRATDSMTTYPRPVPNIPKPANEASFPVNQLQNNMLGVAHMHRAGLDGEGVLIAVMDGGFHTADTSAYFYDLHKDKRVVDAYDFVSNLHNPYWKGTHGTSVLSIMAAYKANDFIGVAPQAQYALYITEDGQTEYRIEEYNWLFAAERADSLGADIIHTSLGYKDFDADSMDYTLTEMNGQHAIISQAAAMAHARGMLVIAAMGNAGEIGVGAPADAKEALSIAAVGVDLQSVSFSSIGKPGPPHTKPDLAAMGLYTLCVNDYGVAFESGTSLAAPLVSGLAAGLWQAFPHLTNDTLAHLLRTSGDQADTPDHFRGYGVPHFLRASVLAYPTIQWTTDTVTHPYPIHGNLVCVQLPEDIIRLTPVAHYRVYTVEDAGKLITFSKTQPVDARRMLLDLADLPGRHLKMELHLHGYDGDVSAVLTCAFLRSIPPLLGE